MNKLGAFLEKHHVADSREKAEILMQYMEEILMWNEKVNLTGITDRDEFVQKHFIDSLLVIDSTEFNKAKSIIDIGTGGGFPGVPLAVCFPEKDFLLMDSLSKKIKIVKEICQELDIKNVTAVHGRAEEMARHKELRETFQLCVSRAVANMSTLSEYCLPFIEKGGTFIAYKGPDCEDEIEDAKEAIKILGGKLLRIEIPKQEETDFEHKLVFVLKDKETPKAFPRKAGRPGKEPIKRK